MRLILTLAFFLPISAFAQWAPGDDPTQAQLDKLLQFCPSSGPGPDGEPMDNTKVKNCVAVNHEVRINEIETFGGVQGPAGPQGAQGEPGVQGEQGAPGAAGPAGPMGFAGIPGAQGPAGEAGPAGATGATGATGAPGADGADGVDGVDGVDGADGAQGIAGPIGATGPAGAQGEPGATGPQGAPGPQGPIGEPGVVDPGIVADINSNANAVGDHEMRIGELEMGGGGGLGPVLYDKHGDAIGPMFFLSNYTFVGLQDHNNAIMSFSVSAHQMTPRTYNVLFSSATCDPSEPVNVQANDAIVTNAFALPIAPRPSHPSNRDTYEIYKIEKLATPIVQYAYFRRHATGACVVTGATAGIEFTDQITLLETWEPEKYYDPATENRTEVRFE